MTYNPTKWKPGDLITSKNMNKIEQELADNDNDIQDAFIKSNLGYVHSIDVKNGFGIINFWDGHDNDIITDSIHLLTDKTQLTKDMSKLMGITPKEEINTIIQDKLDKDFSNKFKNELKNNLFNENNIDIIATQITNESTNNDKNLLVQSKTVANALDQKVNKSDLKIDKKVALNSDNLITNNAVAQKIEEIKGQLSNTDSILSNNIINAENKINALNSSVNNFVNQTNLLEESTKLWQGTLYYIDQGIKIRDSSSIKISDFEYIDFYAEFFSDKSQTCYTFKVPADIKTSSDGYSFILRSTNITNHQTPPKTAWPTLIVGEMYLNIKDDHIKITQNQTWSWDGHVEDKTETDSNNKKIFLNDATWWDYPDSIENPETTDGPIKIKSIWGRKLVKNLEVEDIRTGYDGTVYESAGDAIRNQIQDSDITIKNYCFKNISLEIGTWSLDGITKGTSSNKRFRNQIKQFTKDIYSLTIPTGWEIYIFPLHGNTLLAEPTWEEGTILISDLPESTDSFNFNIRKKGESQNDIQNYLENIQNSIKIVTTFEKELSSLQKEAFKGYGTSNIDISTFISNYGTANTAPKQRIISISSNPSYDMTDYEFPVNVSGILTTLSKSSSTSSYTGTYQYFFTSDGRYFFRFGWSSFGEWKQIFAENATSSPKITLGMFESIAVIGDSFASGSVGVNSQTNYALSWIQNIGRTYGIEATNYSKGGLTTRTWMTNSSGLPKLRADTGKLLYFIALGINDSNPDSRNVPIGVQTDFAIEENTPDTFYGNMGIIYREILAKNSAAIICWITIPRFDARYTPYSEAIRNMAEMTGMILIDSADVTLFKTNWWTNNLSSTAHPTAPMYNAMANAYAEKFSEVAINYMSLLNSYGGFINNNPSSSNNPEDPEV